MCSGRCRSRTCDLVRVKQTRSKTAMDWGGIAQECWTSWDCCGPGNPENRHQTATKTDLRSVVMRLRLTHRANIGKHYAVTQEFEDDRGANSCHFKSCQRLCQLGLRRSGRVQRDRSTRQHRRDRSGRRRDERLSAPPHNTCRLATAGRMPIRFSAQESDSRHYVWCGQRIAFTSGRSRVHRRPSGATRVRPHV